LCQKKNGGTLNKIIGIREKKKKKVKNCKKVYHDLCKCPKLKNKE